MPDPAIFISYRIADTQVQARLLFTDLANHFGAEVAFLDKKRLESGMDWPDELACNVQKAQVLLVLIREKGKWLGINDEGIRRTDDPKDWVRLEIEHAEAAGKIIIPLFFDGAGLPSESALPESLWFLHRKQGCKIATEKWDSDVALLFADLEKIFPRKKSDLAAERLHPLAEYPLPVDIPDPLEHHPAPFLGLPYFDRTAARLFFGRTREILEFFSLVENPDVRIISLFGHSGVGKSSLLAAGIRPRLDVACQSHYERRKITAGLGNQLIELRRKPKTAGRPTVYILDQVEEIFTDPLPGEQSAFIQSLHDTIREEPNSTIVLGFRSDYQLDISDLLARVDCRQEDLPLRPLDHTALIESIEGVWRDPVLAKRYKLELEKGFAAFVVRNLLHNESGGAAAILQNRLLKLYEQAQTRRTPAEPLIQLRIADYEELSRNASAEEELLDFQIQRLCDDAQAGTDERTILEVLDRFVLDKPTAGTLAKTSLPDDPKNLRAALRKVNLLTELPESQAIRLSHDLLAPIVRRRYQQILLDKAERLEIENMRLRLRRVREYLENIDFAGALKELEVISLINPVSKELWPLVFELAFVFLQAHKEEGMFGLLRCVGYLDFAGTLRPAFPDITFPYNRDFSELLDYIRRCDPALFIKMERRYFPTMIRVEGGTFEMGDVLGDKHSNNETVHTAMLASYELAETPLTWQQYGLFCLATEHKLPNDNGFGRGERPAINVSWYDAVEYANWLSQSSDRPAFYSIDKNKKDSNNQSEFDGLKWAISENFRAVSFRLPTEAEWEYAARDRGKPIRFGNGRNTANPAEMNFDPYESSPEGYSLMGEAREATTPVRQFLPNALGFFDMSGNILEWCNDWFGEYPTTPKSNPTGPEKGEARVFRGGSWYDGAQYCRATYRNHSTPIYDMSNLGFRLALSLESAD